MSKHANNQRRDSVRSAALLLAGGTACFALLLAVVMFASGFPTAAVSGGEAPLKEEPTEALSPVGASVVLDTPAEEPKPEEEADHEDDPNAAAREALAARLSEDVAPVASSSGMQVGACVIDLTTGAVAGFQGDQSMVSASMIKLIVAATFLEQVEAGAYDLDDYYTLQSSDLVGGTGTIAWRGAGAAVSYRELLEKMISASDNTAANVLIRAVGMEAINAEAARLGLASTQLNRLMMDEVAMSSGIENHTSANDCAKLLRMVYDGSLVNDESSALVMQALQQQEDWGGIRNGLPTGVPFAHKTGALGNARHDGGIVLGEHPFVIVVLCSGDGFYEQGALDVMARIAAVAYEDIVG